MTPSCSHQNFQPFESESLAHPGSDQGAEFTLGKCADCSANLLHVFVVVGPTEALIKLDPDDYQDLWEASSRAERLALASRLWQNKV